MLIAVCPLASAAEHVTLKNGFELDCVKREVDGEHVRLYLSNKAGEAANYLEVAANSIVKIETLPAESNYPATPPANKVSVKNLQSVPTATEMTEMLARAGEQHHIDADMLASVIHAESGGHVRAVSRTGAKGLMQLMPGTAAQLGVEAYLDQLLTRYHDNVALALAAYNAGPGAVDRWHGVPPYRETQEYVARVIREFNRRKQMLLTASTR
jgi:soluble lytic murein transglycosylase-like protein